MHSTLNRETIRAYRRAIYRVLASPPWCMTVDVASAKLLALQRRRGVACSAFITACNPRGVPQAGAMNAKRQRALQADIARMGLAALPGRGDDPGGRWPGEASFLVLGLTLPDARALGQRHAQNAILWAAADAVPRLVLLR